MKPQAPSSKLQRNTKLQASKALAEDSRAAQYPQLLSHAVVLNDGPNGKDANRHDFDLEERTAKFGEAIVRFSKRIPRDPTNNRLIDQLVGCGTSIGANYCEANESVSNKDFRFSISRCVKEAKETKLFLRLIVASEVGLAEEARQLFREAKELHLIFASMYRR